MTTTFTPTDWLDDLADLSAQAGRHLGALAALARDSGRAELARRLTDETAQIDSGRPVLAVVAGEPCQGKSYLLNALVGRPGLLPVDADVSTGVHVVLRGAEIDQAHIYLGDREEPEVVPVGAIGDYVSVTENPGNVKAVRVVEVDVRSRLLGGGLHLVDTPGVGALDAAHGRLTLAALSSADALVFVIDASGPISQPELDFLANAAQRLDTVLIVLTKVDNHPQWRTVLDEDRALIAEHAPALADVPIVAVSARLALAAPEDGPAPLRERVYEQSGLAQVESWLRADVGARRRRIRLRNAMRSGVSAADQLALLYDRALGTLTPAADRPDELATEQRHLAELKRGSATWRSRLYEALGRSERVIGNELSAAMGSVRTRMEVEISQRWNSARQASLGDDLKTELDALQVELHQSMQQHFSRAATESAESLGIEEVELAPFAFNAVESVDADHVDPDPITASDKMRLVRQMMLPALGVTTGFGTPFALIRILVTLTAGKMDLDGMRRGRDQKEARRFMSDVLAAYQRELGLAVNEAVQSARRAIDEAITAVVEDRLNSLAVLVRDLTREADDAGRTREQYGRIADLRDQVAATRSGLLTALGDAGGAA